MEAWIEFGRGPLFRLTFVLMVLGLSRVFILSIIGMIEAYGKNDDKRVPWKELISKTFLWLVPVTKLWTKRPLYSVISFSFHIGLILVPLFLAAHVLLWKESVGFGWFTIPQSLANWLTLLTVVAGFGLFFGRVLHRGARYLSRGQDILWPPLLVLPFLTGYLCSNVSISPVHYNFFMIIHIYSADLIMLMIPFTKVAHCVLMPLSQFVTGIGWKMPVGAGDRVMESLGYAGRPTWVDNSRLGGKRPADVALTEKVKA